MLNPSAILQQVQQGTISTTWRVFRGKGSSPVGIVFGGCFTFIFISILLGICSVTVPIFLAGNRLIGSSVFSFSDLLTPTFLLVPFIAIAVTALSVYLMIRASNRSRDSVLIITPEGVVQAKQISQPEKQNFKTLDFSLLNGLQLRTTTHHSENSSSTSFWLDVQMRNGQHDKWPLDSQYDRPEAIAQYIIEAFSLYRHRSAF